MPASVFFKLKRNWDEFRFIHFKYFLLSIFFLISVRRLNVYLCHAPFDGKWSRIQKKSISLIFYWIYFEFDYILLAFCSKSKLFRLWHCDVNKYRLNKNPNKWASRRHICILCKHFWWKHTNSMNSVFVSRGSMDLKHWNHQTNTFANWNEWDMCLWHSHLIQNNTNTRTAKIPKISFRKISYDILTDISHSKNILNDEFPALKGLNFDHHWISFLSNIEFFDS